MYVTPSHTDSFIIVGAGVFGAATALSLIQDNPKADVLLVDSSPYPNPRAASHDINKIIRPDYADPLYFRLMAEAMPYWRTSPLYSRFYHEVGVMRIDPSDFASRCMRNHIELVGEAKCPAKWLSVTEARSIRGGVLQDAEFGDMQKVYWNPEAGWAEAMQVLAEVINEAVRLGVKYSSAGVQKVCVDAVGGHCTGIELANGHKLEATKVILAAGARTSTLLVDSDPKNCLLHTGNRLVATGAASFYLSVADEAKKTFHNVPVVKSSLPGVRGENMGMTHEGVLKFNCDISFTNMQVHPLAKSLISTPPNSAAKTTWTTGKFPVELRERAASVLRGSYGRLIDGMQIEQFRMCWDASTPNHDFLICQHPHASGLFIASGGSFHGFKFLPIIGKYVVDLILGKLEVQLAERWSWDGAEGGTEASNSYNIEADLQDFTDE